MRVEIPLGKTAGRAAVEPQPFPTKRLLLLLAATLLSMAAGYAGYQRFAASAQPVAAPQMVPARLGSLVSTVSATGSVVATRQAKLSFLASGRLAELNVAVGSAVKAGQPLARLDTQALQIKVAQAESTLKVNQTKLQQLKEGAMPEEVAAAKASHEAALAKYQEVVAGPTTAEHQAARSAVDQATASLASARAKLDQLKAGPIQADLIAAEGAVDQAKSSLVSAQARLDQVKAGPTQADWASAQSAVQQAKTSLLAAQDKLDQLKAGPTQADLAAAQVAVNQAKVSLTSAQDKYEAAQGGNLAGSGATSNSAAQQAYDAAKAGYDSAVQKLQQLQAGPTAVDLQAAQSGVDSADASLKAAMAKLEQLKQGPLPADLTSAQSGVDQARVSIASAQARLDQLKAGPTESDLASAQGAVDSAEASLASARARLDELQAGPRASEIQSARSTLAGAEAQLAAKTGGPKETDLILSEEQVRQAEIALEQARLDLQNATLVAPFDGVVALVTPNVGEQVSGAVLTLVDPRAIRIDATVDESDVGKLAPGQPATVSFDALPDQRLPGKVIAVAPSGTTQQGVVSYLVSVGADSPGRPLPAGMTASLSIETERKDGILLVPNRALRTQGRNRTVEVMVGEKTEVRVVQTGSSNDQFTQITSGLKEGEQVVIPVTTTVQPRVMGPGQAPAPAVKVRQ